MKTIIFTDGASRGNPGPGGWGAVVLENSTVTELGGREIETTNNRMELTAVIEALKKSEAHNIEVFTDSSYVVNGITKWIHSWEASGWKTKARQAVLNKDLWKKLHVAAMGRKIDWHIVPGHAGLPGNERCDVIATSFADNLSAQAGKPTELFSGNVSDYDVDLTNLEINESAKVKKDRARSKAKAYSYVSEVNGVVKTHKTWAECEARVRGKKARFKKALTPSEEKELIEEFSQ